MVLKIKNARVVAEDKVIENGILVAEDGIITYVGEENGSYADEIYDAEGNYLVAGFVDIHSHGGNGYDFMDATAEEMLKISKFHLTHGTTTLVATTVTDTWENIEHALDTYKALGDNRLTLNGVHLEGPWFSPEQCGAQSVSQMDRPSTEKLAYLIKKYPFIRRISLAPEVDEGFEVGRFGKENGVIVALGHTDADFDTVESAAENGYSLITHLYSDCNDELHTFCHVLGTFF